MGFYPILINLEGQQAVVVGGGRVAERKIQTLLAHGAKVRVVAKALTAALTKHVQTGGIEHLGAEFQEKDLDDAFLVVAATDNPSLNRRVSEIARKKRLLVNAVDQPSDCNFIVPSILKRGDLVIAVSTSGKSPALARRIREALEGVFGEEYEALLVLMGRLRGEILARGRSPEENKGVFQEVIRSDILAAIRENDMEKVASLLSEILEKPISPRQARDYLKTG